MIDFDRLLDEDPISESNYLFITEYSWYHVYRPDNTMVLSEQFLLKNLSDQKRSFFPPGFMGPPSYEEFVSNKQMNISLRKVMNILILHNTFKSVFSLTDIDAILYNQKSPNFRNNVFNSDLTKFREEHHCICNLKIDQLINIYRSKSVQEAS